MFQALTKNDSKDLALRLADMERLYAEVTEKYEALQAQLEAERGKSVSDETLERIAELNAIVDRQLYELKVQNLLFVKMWLWTID